MKTISSLPIEIEKHWNQEMTLLVSYMKMCFEKRLNDKMPHLSCEPFLMMVPSDRKISEEDKLQILKILEAYSNELLIAISKI